MLKLGETTDFFIGYIIILILVCLFSYPLLMYFGGFGEVEALIKVSLTAFFIHTIGICIIEYYSSREPDHSILIFLYNIFPFFFFYILGMALIEWFVRAVSLLPF